MKLVIGAAFAALALAATAAMAQTPPAQTPAAIPPSRCVAIPAAPTFPDGARARNQAVMQQGNAAYEAWGRQTQEVLACRQTEARELRTQAETARLHAEARVQEFNRAVAGQCDVVRAWRAEVAEYNERQGQETPPIPPGDPCAQPAAPSN